MMRSKESVLTRVWNLLSPDKVEIRNIYIFAIFSGLISLGLPLGIQMIINFIQLGQLSASWFLLVGLVVAALGLSGVMNILQLRITENIQQEVELENQIRLKSQLTKETRAASHLSLFFEERKPHLKQIKSSFDQHYCCRI